MFELDLREYQLLHADEEEKIEELNHNVPVEVLTSVMQDPTILCTLSEAQQKAITNYLATPNKETQGELYKHFSNLNYNAVCKPYLRRKDCEYIIMNDLPSNLNFCDGDILHFPVSQYETLLLSDYLKNGTMTLVEVAEYAFI